MQWLRQNPKYQDLAERPIPHGTLSFRVLSKSLAKPISQHVIELFVEAARNSPAIDPDVHVALGLLYNCTWEYDKALECFKAALTVRPDDYALWNKFGATMANSLHGREHADVAIDAYWRALESMDFLLSSLTNFTRETFIHPSSVELRN
jgi:peroxin-5